MTQYTFRNAMLDLATGQLTVNGQHVPLPRLPFDVLTYLIEHQPQIVPRDELRAQVWGPRLGVPTPEVTDAAIYRVICQVREAINDLSESIIITARGKGYRFSDQVPVSSNAQGTPEQIIGMSSDGQSSPSPESMIDRCVALLLGIAMGDAFGAGYINQAPTAVMERFHCTGYDRAPVPQSAHRAGHYTDDTQMSLAIVQALLSGKAFTTDTLAQCFHDAYHDDTRPGYSERMQAALAQPTVAGCIAHFQTSVTAGAAMRAVPLGVLPDIATVWQYACINAETTHRTPEAIASSVAVALASHYFFYRHGPVANVFTFCLDHMAQNHLPIPAPFSTLAGMQDLHSGALQALGWTRTRGLGLAAIEMAGAALLLASQATSPAQLLQRAVHCGGATDTLASIALGLFAARASITSLPAFLSQRLERGPYGYDYIITMGKRLAAVCPLPQPCDGVLEPIEPVFLKEIMQQLMRQLSYKMTDMLVSLSPQGSLVACAAAMATGLRFGVAAHAPRAGDQAPVTFRTAAGEERYLYGLPLDGDVILVDAAITTGDTVIHISHALTHRGRKVLGVVVLFESTRHDARAQLEAGGITLVSKTQHTCTMAETD